MLALNLGPWSQVRIPPLSVVEFESRFDYSTQWTKRTERSKICPIRVFQTSVYKQKAYQMGHQMIRLMHLIFNSNQFSNSLQSKNRADGAKQGATNQFGIGKNPKYRKNGKKRDFSFSTEESQFLANLTKKWIFSKNKFCVSDLFPFLPSFQVLKPPLNTSFSRDLLFLLRKRPFLHSRIFS